MNTPCKDMVWTCADSFAAHTVRRLRLHGFQYTLQRPHHSKRWSLLRSPLCSSSCPPPAAAITCSAMNMFELARGVGAVHLWFSGRMETYEYI